MDGTTSYTRTLARNCGGRLLLGYLESSFRRPQREFIVSHFGMHGAQVVLGTEVLCRNVDELIIRPARRS
jgi:hypothetical protein